PEIAAAGDGETRRQADAVVLDGDRDLAVLEIDAHADPPTASFGRIGILESVGDELVDDEGERDGPVGGDRKIGRLDLERAMRGRALKIGAQFRQEGAEID